MIIFGHTLSSLRKMPDNMFQAGVTSPPYFGLRNYGTQPQVWGGDPNCDHLQTVQAAARLMTGGTASAKQRSNVGGQFGNWQVERYYAERGGLAASSGEAFSQPGPDNAARIKAARWQTSITCTVCNAWFGELGSEPHPQMYIAHLVEIMREVKRVLRPDGVFFLNIADNHAGSGKGPTGHNGHQNAERRQGFVDRRSPTTDNKRNTASQGLRVPLRGYKPKDLYLIPERLSVALQDDGWWVRSHIIWAKPNPMTESMRDRPTRAHESVYMLTKTEQNYWDFEAIQEPAKDGKTRNIRNVWTIPTRGFPGAHFAVFPEALVEPCIKAATSERGACTVCKAPWVRVVERETNWPERKAAGATAGNVGVSETYQGGIHGKGQSHDLGGNESRTVAWAPSCKCGVQTVQPCLVLDPFGGSGTVEVVARRLGRKAVLIELQAEYVAIARHRIGGIKLMKKGVYWYIPERADMRTELRSALETHLKREKVKADAVHVNPVDLSKWTQAGIRATEDTRILRNCIWVGVESS